MGWYERSCSRPLHVRLCGREPAHFALFVPVKALRLLCHQRAESVKAPHSPWLQQLACCQGSGTEQMTMNRTTRVPVAEMAAVEKTSTRLVCPLQRTHIHLAEASW